MKKNVLILLILFTGILGLSAQKSNTVFDKNGTEVASQKKDYSIENVIPRINVNGKTLNISNVENGTSIEIYSALGAKIQTIVFNGNPVALTNLNKGVYIVRIGRYTQKIML